jgi:hypothetical protein
MQIWPKLHSSIDVTCQVLPHVHCLRPPKCSSHNVCCSEVRQPMSNANDAPAFFGAWTSRLTACQTNITHNGLPPRTQS